MYMYVFFFNDTATTEIYTLSLHDALPIYENQTLASITFQNYFRLYPKLAGMTGTAETEAAEFSDIYRLDVLPIPSNEPNCREDFNDQVFKTRREKYNAVINAIQKSHGKGQPILVGTASVETSETLARLLKRSKIPHSVLNAKYHRQEAEIISRAGQRGSVTVSTNMAGRGTDIKLGEGIPEIGGLMVIGTERHESRRIDNQLRGRSGRQGDPGASKFFLSLEDDLMRIFGSERIDSMLQKLGLEEGEAIIHPWVNKALEKAQQKVEARNFDIRKNLLKFDDVMNDQRKVIYEQRREIMTANDVAETVTAMRDDVISDMVARCIPAKAYSEQWETNALHEEALRLIGVDLPIEEWAREEGIDEEEIRTRIQIGRAHV